MKVAGDDRGAGVVNMSLECVSISAVDAEGIVGIIE